MCSSNAHALHEFEHLPARLSFGMLMPIDGGYYIKARKLQQSSIARKPPVVREVWDWLLYRVNFKDTPNLKRGQAILTINEIKEGLSWYVGFRKETYSDKQIRKTLEGLTKEGMIVTTKVTHAMLITVCNYSLYQDPKNYEGQDEGQDEGHTNGIQRAQYSIRKKEGKKENTTTENLDLEIWNEICHLFNGRVTNPYPISDWLKMGATKEVILDVVNERIKQGANITSLKYFTSAIEDRINKPKKGKQNGKTESEISARIMDRIKNSGGY